jgi:integrase
MVAQVLPSKDGSGFVARVKFSNTFIESPKRVPASGRAEYHDSGVPGLVLRVGSGKKGRRSFALLTRFPPPPAATEGDAAVAAPAPRINPTRRTIGVYGKVTLEQARETARAWLAMIEAGRDPAIEQATKRARNQRARTNTFEHVAREFLRLYASKIAHEKDAKHVMESQFIRRWGARPINDIQTDEIAAAIREIAEGTPKTKDAPATKGTPAQARNSLGYLKRMYSWAIGTHEYGVVSNPAADLKPKNLNAAKVIRERVLFDSELAKVWAAAEQIGYPAGSVVQLLILTGQRLREIADLSWSEIDFEKSLIVIPSSRMKGHRVHEIPICPDTLALLKSLPRFTRGDFVFTTTGGARPFAGFGKVKIKLDQLSGFTDWVLHDLRRTARTHFSALPVQDIVRELVIAHAQKGLHAVYDQHSYQDEKRDCLRLWEARLRGILHPAPASVADIGQARDRRRQATTGAGA